MRKSLGIFFLIFGIFFWNFFLEIRLEFFLGNFFKDFFSMKTRSVAEQPASRNNSCKISSAAACKELFGVIIYIYYTATELGSVQVVTMIAVKNVP
jgi:hypothetical protein